MILTPETIQIITDSAMLAPAVALGGDPTPAPATPASGGRSIGKAVMIGFLALIIINGNMPANTQFALIIGIAAYFLLK